MNAHPNRNVTALSALLLLVTCFAAACESPKARFAQYAEGWSPTMQALYPPGAAWRQPEDAFGAFERWTFDAPAPDGFAQHALEHARARSGSVHCCWWGDVPRRSAGSSLGAMGMYRDYVFVDSRGLVVVAYRSFVD